MVLAGRALCLSSDGLLLPKTETKKKTKKKLHNLCALCGFHEDDSTGKPCGGFGAHANSEELHYSW